jgi:uncharacterized protein involved in outer membrane biogenesis
MMAVQRRWRWVLVASALLLAALVAGEWAAWPFLAAPLERWLASGLDRRVDLAADGGFGVRFVGGLHVTAAQVVIGAPTWSSAPHLLRATEVQLDLAYGDLWRARHGEALRIASLRAAAADVHLERMADGRSSWNFGPVTTADDAPLAAFGHLHIGRGSLHVDDKLLSLVAQADLAQGGGPAPVFTLQASGNYRKLPLKVDLTASGPLPWVESLAPAPALPVVLNASVGRARLAFTGSATDALHLNGLKGRFDLTGPSLAAVGAPLGVVLPTTAAFHIVGALIRDGHDWLAVLDDARIGASRLNGAFSFQTGRPLPLLTGRLGGSRLALVDLGPAIGSVPDGPAAGGARLLPDRDFDLSALRAMEADVRVDILEVDLDARLLEPLRPLRAHLQLAGGVLSLGGIDARTGQGRLAGDVRLDGRGQVALWTAALRWDDVQLERWLRAGRADGKPAPLSGRLDGSAQVRGQGRSTAAILASLDGRVRSELRDGAISHVLIEAAGLDLAESLGLMLKGDDKLPVRCAVADLAASAGVLRPRALVLDTADSTLWVEGSVSLASETVDLRAVVMPSDFSPLTLRTPLRVTGSLAAPKLSLDKGPMARKLAAAFLLAWINPLAALIPLLDPGNADAATRGAAGCQELAQRGPRAKK